MLENVARSCSKERVVYILLYSIIVLSALAKTGVLNSGGK